MDLREKYKDSYLAGLAKRDPWPDVHMMLSRDEVALVCAALDTLACAPRLGSRAAENEMESVIRGLRRKISMLAFGRGE